MNEFIDVSQQALNALKFGIPRIIRLFCHDLRHKAPTGRFNTLSGYLQGFDRLHAFGRAYRWAVANGYNRPDKKPEEKHPYSVFDYYPYGNV